jgi:hypothetical protein
VLWFLLWLVLVLAAAAFFAYLGRHLWRKAKAMTAELGAASHRLGKIANAISESSSPPHPRPSDLR